MYIIRLKIKLRSLTEDEIQDFLEGDQTIPVEVDSSAKGNECELSIDRMSFPQRFRLLPESYTIGKRLISITHSFVT